MTAPTRLLVASLCRLARVAFLSVLWLALSSGVSSADVPKDDKAKPMETKKVEIYRLTNEELLKQADAIYLKASQDYLAQLRALATAELLLYQLRLQAAEEAAKPPLPVPPKDPPTTVVDEDLAKKTLDAAKTKQETVKRKGKLLQDQKTLLDRIATSLEGCQSALVAFLNALDDLKAYVLESGLRVKDGSLTEDKLSSRLKADFLDKKRTGLLEHAEQLKTKAIESQKSQEAIGKQREEANKAALAAEAEVVEASRGMQREQQRKELEKTYVGRKPDTLVPELARMVEEGIGLKGTYELALRRFQSRANKAAASRKELDALKQPEAKVPQLTRAEDVETAAKSIQEQIGFYTLLIGKIDALQSALTSVVQAGGEFEADAAVSDEHLFKMNVLANLLRKQGVTEQQLPEKARAAELGPATVRQKDSASAVRAATEKAKGEMALLDQRKADAATAADAAAKQLANLKESRDVTLAALQWEGQLKGMTGPQVVEAFNTARKEFAERQEKLKGEVEAYEKGTAAVAVAKARLDGLKDPFLRAAEEQGQGDKKSILGDLRKEAGLERTSKDAETVPSTADPKKTVEEKKTPPDTRTDLEKAIDKLFAFQQVLSGRVRVLDEREGKKKELLTALDDLEKKAAVYSKSLADARLLSLRLNATAVDLKKRLGKGALPSESVPEGVTEALRQEPRTNLDATAATVLNVLNQLEQDREQLRRPHPEAEALTAATKELLTIVGRRLDLLADLQRLIAEYKLEKSARPASEIKRLEQLASERRDEESSGWDTFLGIDASKPATSLSELLESYYRELIEIEEKEENLGKQREKVDQLLELTRQETEALTKVLPILAKQLTQLESSREEETVLVRARLRPERAEELLKTYQTKTGRLLNKPLPIADKEKGEKVEEFGNLLFERYVMVEAMKKWDEVLNARMSPMGVKAEAGTYQDEMAKLTAASAANTRRVHALQGRETPEPAIEGEIDKTRSELDKVRKRGLKRIGIKIGCILLAAILLPWLLMGGLQRAIGGTKDESSLSLSALRAILKITVWVTACAMILSTLGFDVTAIIAGLGIGGLAVGLAAQSMISDVIGAIVIFAERRFKIGDVIRLENEEPARVVGLSWRSTQVKNAEGQFMTIPNRKVTEATIENLTKAGRTYDSLNVAISTEKDADTVLSVMQRAMGECSHLASDHGVSVREFNQKGESKIIKYRFWWFLKDYDLRGKIREEVIARITSRLAHEDMVGTKVRLA